MSGFLILSGVRWNVHCPQRVFHRWIAPDMNILIVCLYDCSQVTGRKAPSEDRSKSPWGSAPACFAAWWLATYRTNAKYDRVINIILHQVRLYTDRLTSEVTFYWTYTAPTGGTNLLSLPLYNGKKYRERTELGANRDSALHASF